MKEEIEGIKVYRYWTYSSPKKTTINRLLNYLSFLISSLFFVLNKEKYDVIITTSPPLFIAPAGYIISRLKKIPLIFDVRDVWPDIAVEMDYMDEKSKNFKILNSIADFMYKKSELILAVSSSKCTKLEKKGIKKEKIKFISNGFDKEFLNISIDDEIVKKYELKKKKSIIYTGIIGLAQGLDIIIDLAEEAKKNSEFQFLMIGDGVERERLEEEAKKRGLKNISFLGFQPHDKIKTFLEYACLSIIPLINKNLKDSVPTKLFESLGSKCPVFLIAEGESREILNVSKGGVGVSPEKKEEISLKFREFLNGKINIDSKFASEFILENYSRELIAQKLEKEVKRIVSL